MNTVKYLNYSNHCTTYNCRSRSRFNLTNNYEESCFLCYL